MQGKTIQMTTGFSSEAILARKQWKKTSLKFFLKKTVSPGFNTTWKYPSKIKVNQEEFIGQSAIKTILNKVLQVRVIGTKRKYESSGKNEKHWR